MQGSHLVAALLAGVLVGGGVWIGATVFGGDKGESAPAPRLEAEPAAPPQPAPPPMLGSKDDDALSRRLAALERGVHKILALLGPEGEKLEPIMQIIEQAKAMGMIAEDGSPLAGGVAMGAPAEDLGGVDAHSGPGYAFALGEQLGLDAARTDALKKAADEIFEKIKVLEKENAKVTKEGDTTTITIQPYNGDVLKRDWEDWVARNLNPDEQAKLKKQHATNRLFGSRLGDHERTIKIKEAAGGIEVSESAKTPGGGGAMRTQMQGPAMARDVMLKPYEHLLK